MTKFQTDALNPSVSDSKSSLLPALDVQECDSVGMVETAMDGSGNEISKKHFEIYFQAARFLLPKQFEQMVYSKIKANTPDPEKTSLARIIDLFTDRTHLAELLKSTNPSYLPLDVQTIADELIGDVKVDYPLVSLKEVKTIADLRSRHGVPGVPDRGLLSDIFTIDSPLNTDIHFRVKDPEAPDKKWYTVDLKVFFGPSFEALEEKLEVFNAVQDITLQVFDFLKHGFEYEQANQILTYFLIFNSNDEPFSFFDRCQKIFHQTDESYQRVGNPQNMVSTLYLVYFGTPGEEKTKTIFEIQQPSTSDAADTARL